MANKKKRAQENIQSSSAAERQGFEPRVHRCTPVFKTGAIDHSAISPREKVGGEGFEPTKPKQQIYSLSHLTTLETSQTNKLCSRLRMQISHNKSTYTRLAFQKMRLPYVNRHTICIRQAERDGLILKTITPMRITKCAWA